MSKLNVIVGLGLSIIALILITLSLPAEPVTAQADNLDMAGRVSALWNRVLEEQTSANGSTFSFTVTFNDSISGIGNSITLGQSLNTTTIDSIGTDHLCFSRVFSRAANIDCVPFSNISKITYQQPVES
jgi:hypothetical protein